MEKSFIGALLLLPLLFCQPAHSQPTSDGIEGKITVNATGFKNDRGVARIALFNSAASYRQDNNVGDGAFRKIAIPIKDRKAIAIFDKIPMGDYAIKMFHDEDNTGKFKNGVFGNPKVGYGFSNNARGAFGAPGWEQAQFHMNKAELSQDIFTRY